MAATWAEPVEPRLDWRDFVDALSGLGGSFVPLASARLAVEFFGLSVLPEPGIFDLSELRMERVDSRVSARSKERYCSRSSDRPSGPDPDLSPFSFLGLDWLLPIASVYGLSESRYRCRVVVVLW